MTEKITFAVGTTQHPLPMSDPNRMTTDNPGDVPSPDTSIAALMPIKRTIVLVRDDTNPLLITTDRPFAQALGMLYSELAMPDMMAIEMEAIRLRQSGSSTAIQAVLGITGAGKTFASRSLANICDTRGLQIANCYKGMDLSELLWETVLDTGAETKSAFEEIAHRFAKGTLKDSSMAILSGLADANAGDDLRWNLIGSKDGVKSREQWEADMQALRLVAQNEGLEKSGDFLFTLRKTEGVLIRTWREGREALVDEYEKSQPGSEVALYGLMQVLNGEEPEFVSHGGPGQSFTFLRDERPQGAFVTLAGNLMSDGRTGRLMNDSEAARIQPRTVEKITPEGMQQRIEQVMTGVPISTWYHSRPEQWNAEPGQFRQFLRDILTNARGGNAPSHQLAQIDNWSNVMQASAMLTQFHTAVAYATNPEWLHSHNLSGIAREVTPELRKNLGAGDLRFIGHDILNARSFIPKMAEPNTGKDIDVASLFSTPSPMPAGKPEPLEAHYGDRLMQVTYDRVMKAIGDRPHLRQYIDKIAQITGIRELTMDEAPPHPDHRTLGDLINTSAAAEIVPVSEQAKEVQQIMVAYLRKRYPGLSVNDEDLVPAALIETLLGTLVSKQISTGTNVVTLPNLDRNETAKTPFLHLLVQDSIAFPNGGAAAFKKADNLFEADKFLEGLAMPKVRDGILQNIYTDAMTAGGKAERNDAIDIAQNTHPRFGLSTVSCSVQLAGIKSKSYFHLLHDKQSDTLLAVGDAIDDATVAALAKNHVTYISRNETGSEAAVETELRKMLRGPERDADSEALSQAFVLRNPLKPGVRDDTSLAALLTNTALSDMLLPVQMTKLTEEMLATDTRFKGLKALIDTHQKSRSGKEV